MWEANSVLRVGGMPCSIPRKSIWDGQYYIAEGSQCVSSLPAANLSQSALLHMRRLPQPASDLPFMKHVYEQFLIPLTS